MSHDKIVRVEKYPDEFGSLNSMIEEPIQGRVTALKLKSGRFKRTSTKENRATAQSKRAYSSFMNGEFLPPQLIYQGKTTRCLPHYDFPPAYSPNHWSNEETMSVGTWTCLTI